MNRWIYFGAHSDGAGHGTYSEGMRRLTVRYGSRDLTRFDTMLPIQIDTEPYVATISRLGGWGFTALAFWDNSVDKRPGSNSIIFCPDLTISHDEMLSESQRRFPEVFKRLPKPLVLAHTLIGGAL